MSTIPPCVRRNARRKSANIESVNICKRLNLRHLRRLPSRSMPQFPRFGVILTFWKPPERSARTHGGARIVVPRSRRIRLFGQGHPSISREKEAIGRACAELIEPNQSVILDAGHNGVSTWRDIWKARRPQIVTNSLPVANHFASANRLKLCVSGGVIYPRLGVLVGPLAVEAFRKIHADVAVMSAGGLRLEGITNSHGLLIDIQRAMIARPKKLSFASITPSSAGNQYCRFAIWIVSMMS